MGYEVAKAFLENIGVHPEVRKAILMDRFGKFS